MGVTYIGDLACMKGKRCGPDVCFIYSYFFEPCRLQNRGGRYKCYTPQCELLTTVSTKIQFNSNDICISRIYNVFSMFVQLSRSLDGEQFVKGS